MAHTPYYCKETILASAKWWQWPNLLINYCAAVLLRCSNSIIGVGEVEVSSHAEALIKSEENRRWKAPANEGAVASLKYMQYIKQTPVCVLYIRVHGNWGLLLPRLHLSRSDRRRWKQACLHQCGQQHVPSGQQELIASSVMGTN